MRVIPVLDLQGGQVVRAIAGERDRYRRIHSVLTGEIEPADIAAAIFDLVAFPRLYVADLDAISQSGSRRHFDTVYRLGKECSRRGLRELWLDAGRAEWIGEIEAALSDVGVRLVPVVGTESLNTQAPPESTTTPAKVDEHILSLDFRGGSFLGPPELEADASRWPQRVIVMDLSMVGCRRGPAQERLRKLRDRAATAGRAIDLYAAGGVRDIDDLHNLAAQGVAGALVASALHDGSLDRAALRSLDQDGW